MSSDPEWFDEPENELDDNEYPDGDDFDNDDFDDELTETVPCPECGAEVYEDAVRCPVCGTYITITADNNIWSGRPGWWILLGLLGILAVVVVLAGIFPL